MQYLDKFPVRRGEILERGGAVHACISQYAKHCWDQKLETDFDYVVIVVKNVLDKWRISFEVYDEALEIVKEFASSHIFIPSRIIAVEKWQEMEVGPYLYRGIVDFAEYETSTNTLIVTDYKTSFVIAKQAEVEKDLSLGGYALLLRHNLAPKAQHIVKRLDFVRYSHVVEAECAVEDLKETVDTRLVLRLVCSSVEVSIRRESR